MPTVTSKMALKVICVVLACGFLLHTVAEKAKRPTFQYQQNDYDMTMDIGRIVWYNISYARDVKFDFVLYNRTQRVMNASAYFLKDLDNDIVMTYQAFKFMSNEYRYFPVTLSANLCYEYAHNSFGAQDVLKKTSNWKCPVKKGFYYMRNCLPDFSKFPPYIPRGSYKATYKLYHFNNLILEAETYGRVVDKPVKWYN